MQLWGWFFCWLPSAFSAVFSFSHYLLCAFEREEDIFAWMPGWRFSLFSSNHPLVGATTCNAVSIPALIIFSMKVEWGVSPSPFNSFSRLLNLCLIISSFALVFHSMVPANINILDVPEYLMEVMESLHMMPAWSLEMISSHSLQYLTLLKDEEETVIMSSI